MELSIYEEIIARTVYKLKLQLSSGLIFFSFAHLCVLLHLLCYLNLPLMFQVFILCYAQFGC